ncbi:cell envelope biogenesis protein OmpA [Adhaeribacter aerolatus]|uniref:Cell envelope biogenesis protein OmpA n=1 Tax=Adhaeribacter aerolatus TaxID=670289 RepID=A0A512B361_9BACT|nr:OmpA family protein [Adhaeribacter aerolatus]GEO06405.1 cell envelope biogenesis protein OmpA [Adhaeribacter aerolatus]
MKKVLNKMVAMAFLLSAFLATSVQAQNADNKWAVSGFASVYQYKGNLGTEWFEFGQGRTGGGLSISRYLSPSFDFVAQFSGARIDYNNNVQGGVYAAGRPRNMYFDGETRNIIGAFKLKMNNGKILKEDAFIQPYLMLGYGGAFSDVSGKGAHGLFGENQPANRGTDGDLSHGVAFGAAGIGLRITERLGAFIQTGQIYTFTDQYDGFKRAGDKRPDRFLQHNFGLTFALGKPKDTDMDGVPDRKDKCPDTPSGVKVDENGCPVDTDKDGVPDYQDNCPDVAGVANLNGCPDKDGDGVADAQDQCPDQPGTAALQGCPDADGDGVADQNDKCPGTPAGTQVDATGCPLDADADGVADAADKCPDTPAGTQVDSTGCPLRKPIPRGVGRGTLKDTTYIQFEFDKAVLRKVSFRTLDQVVRFLKANPEFTVNVSGHADATGTDEYNQGLSERRAAAVARYLTARGRLGKERVTTVGYGESRPRADNETAEGRALNRRAQVELVVE